MKQQSFTLPINFFDDDRMIPVSAIYGAVGELVAIRLISLIYSNGYHLEWTQLNRCRILRAIPLITPERLDEIVDCLVASGLFDAELFSREGVLTSADIQSQYLRTHRRRIKPDTDLPYFLIERPQPKDSTPEAHHPETPASDAHSPSPEESNPDLPDLPDHSGPSDLPENLETPEILEILEILEIPESLETLESPESLEIVEILEPSRPISTPPQKSTKALKLKRLRRRRRKRKHKRRC